MQKRKKSSEKKNIIKKPSKNKNKNTSREEFIPLDKIVSKRNTIPKIKKENLKTGGSTSITSKEENSFSLHSIISLPSKKQGDILDRYFVNVDEATIIIEIRKEAWGIFYYINFPEVGPGTQALLNEIRNELITKTTIGMAEIIDPKAFISIKNTLMRETEKLLTSKLPHLEEETKKFLIGKLIQDMLGLGEIEFLVNDPNLEEIVIPSAKEPVRVYHKRYGWLQTNLTVRKEEDIANYSSIIARRVGRQITVLNPLLDAHLPSGDRVNSILYPISTKGNTITIRKFARDPYTIVDMIRTKTCNVEIASLIWLAIEYEMNIIISGGTASGKTSFLNACLPFIPPNHRIITVEDTRELMLPEFLYWTPLVTRAPNPEGKGEVTMLDLLVNSLRMRPDRIILGEMRKKEEAMVLFEAMHTGHSVYATLHADSASETISRLTNPPLSVPPNLLKAVNLNIVMFRDRRKGIRRVLQVAEFETEESLRANILYRWIPEEDEILAHSESSRLFEDLSRITGMSQKEIDEDLQKKSNILSFLVENNIRKLEDVGKVMNLYYNNRGILLDAIKNKDIKKLLS